MLKELELESPRSSFNQWNRWIWFAIGCVVLVVAVFAIWKVPQWQVGLEPLPPAEKARMDAETAARVAVVQAIGGFFLFGTASISFLNLRATQKNVAIAQRNVAVAEEKQVTERFAKAIEMLGNEDNIHIRLGGIYLLGRVAKDSDQDYPQVMEVLTAFVRERQKWILSKSEVGGSHAILLPLLTDVQAALSVIGHVTYLYPDHREGYQLDLSKTNLEKAKLVGAKLQNIYLYSANLHCADLHNANLSSAVLYEINLTEANLKHAVLDGVELNDADLSNAFLESAYLRKASLVRARLHNTDLRGADLSAANFSSAKLEGANFGDAVLVGANFRGTDLSVNNLKNANLSRADLRGISLTFADLTGANLSNANLGGVELKDADLSSANFTGANGLELEMLDRAYLCNTILPDGTKSDRDCSISYAEWKKQKDSLFKI